MRKLLVVIVLSMFASAVAAPQDGKSIADESQGVVEKVAALDATPLFHLADRSQVEAAIQEARRLFIERREMIHELVQASLGAGVSLEASAYFHDSYAALLEGLTPDLTVLDGRRSSHFLDQENRSVKQTLEADPSCAALVVEVRRGEFGIFLGRPFFELGTRRQAEILLHEVLHMLGTGFFDSTFSEFLQERGCYDPALSASQNLQRYVEGRCPLRQ